MKLPTSIHIDPNYEEEGQACPCCQMVAPLLQQMWDQVRKFSDHEIDGFNISDRLPGAGLEFGTSTNNIPRKLINSLGNTAISTYFSLKESTSSPGTDVGMELTVDASDSLGSFCIKDKDYPSSQLMRMVPEDPASIAAPGGTFRTPSGTMIFEGLAGDEFVFNESGAAINFRIESDSNSGMFFVDGTNNRVGLGTSSPTVAITGEGSTVFNESGAAVDFRIESDSDGQMFLVDGTNNRVGISTGAGPTSLFDIAVPFTLTSGTHVNIRYDAATTLTSTTTLLKLDAVTNLTMGAVSFTGLDIDIGASSSTSTTGIDIDSTQTGSNTGAIDITMSPGSSSNISGVRVSLGVNAAGSGSNGAFYAELNSNALGFNVVQKQTGVQGNQIAQIRREGTLTVSDGGSGLLIDYAASLSGGVTASPQNFLMRMIPTFTSGANALNSTMLELQHTPTVSGGSLTDTTTAFKITMTPASSAAVVAFNAAIASNGSASSITLKVDNAGNSGSLIAQFLNNTTERMAIYTSGSVVINETGAATNFRVESDGDANALFVDGTNNRVGILNGSPTTTLDVTGHITAYGLKLNKISLLAADGGSPTPGNDVSVVFIDCTFLTTNYTVNIPSAATYTGRVYTVKITIVGAGGSTVTIDAAAGNVEGAGTLILDATTLAGVVLFSDGTDWWRIAS